MGIFLIVAMCVAVSVFVVYIVASVKLERIRREQK